jgi:hypothetical protein
MNLWDLKMIGTAIQTNKVYNVEFKRKLG